MDMLNLQLGVDIEVVGVVICFPDPLRNSSLLEFCA
jgi:hypothetical protein